MGLMYDDLIGEAEWSTAFPDMMYKDTAQPAQFQVFISDESIDSLMGSWLEVGQIAGWVYGDSLPAYVGATLTCSDLERAFPGISAKYGADSIVEIHFDVTALDDFTSSAADQDVSVYGSANLQFWPRFSGTTELAVELNVIDILFTGGIQIQNFMATGEVSTFLVDKIVVVSSTVGDISTFQLKLEFNTISRILVPSINSILQGYQVPVPQDILGIFILSNLFLTYNDGFIFGGATPTFVPPAATFSKELYEEIMQATPVYKKTAIEYFTQ